MVMSNKSKMKKRVIIGACALVGLAVIAGPVIVGSMSGETAGYLTETATTSTIETYYSFSGNVASSNTQNVMAEKIMQIKEIHVNEGDEVSAGTLLFTTTDGTEITSKIGGTVNALLVETDQQVMSGSQMAEIIDFNQLEVIMNVDEYDLGAIAINQKVAVHIGALAKDIEGTITEISRTAMTQNGVSYFQATVQLNTDDAVKVGMTAEAKILKASAQDVVTIPMTALSFDEENNPMVYTTTADGELTELPVEIGINDGKNVEIKSEIEAGETVYYEDLTAAPSSSFLPPIPGRN
ncbi:MAG: efflux RND transporter periplasmic adaptor subunit [Culicoidibacterales bacterium]